MVIYLISALFFIALFYIIPHVFDLVRETDLGEKLLDGDIWAILFILIISFIPLARIIVLVQAYELF